MPALLTNTSNPPSCATYAFCPAVPTSSAVASAPSESECQVIPTSMPSFARATAVALPIPESDAVTMAYRGSKLIRHSLLSRSDEKSEGLITSHGHSAGGAISEHLLGQGDATHDASAVSPGAPMIERSLPSTRHSSRD